MKETPGWIAAFGRRMAWGWGNSSMAKSTCCCPKRPKSPMGQKLVLHNTLHPSLWPLCWDYHLVAKVFLWLPFCRCSFLLYPPYILSKLDLHQIHTQNIPGTFLSLCLPPGSLFRCSICEQLHLPPWLPSLLSASQLKSILHTSERMTFYEHN